MRNQQKIINDPTNPVIMESLEKTIKQLLFELRKEAMDFVEFLLDKQMRKSGRTLSFDWEGGLKEYRDRFTSLDLQKRASEWWAD